MQVCKNCSNAFEGKFCNHCGQKVYTDKDKSIPSLFAEIFHYLTHFDGSFLTTLKTIFIKPGKLSLDYCNGIRARYFKPLSLYLLTVLLYLIFPFFQGLNVSLKVQEINFPNVVHAQIAEKTKTISYDKYEERYAHTSEKVSKLLLLLFIPVSAFLIWILFMNKKRQAFDLLIYSTEINIVYISVFFLIFPLIALLLYKLFSISIHEDLLVVVVEIIFVSYLAVFFKRLYQEKLWLILLKSSAFAFLHMYFYIRLYRILLFEICNYLL